MKSHVYSKKIPSPSKRARLRLAHSSTASPTSLMKHRTKKYEHGASPFDIQIDDSSGTVDIAFRNRDMSEKISIDKSLSQVNVNNRAFSDYEYDLDLIAATFRSNNGQFKEYFDAIYWGSPIDGQDLPDFVKENANIVKTRFSIGKNLNRPNGVRRYFATDVNAYTKGKQPNPWVYDTILVLYEDDSVAKRIQNHSELGIDKNDFDTVLRDSVLTQSDMK